jgi:hypothetical protein
MISQKDIRYTGVMAAFDGRLLTFLQNGLDCRMLSEKQYKEASRRLYLLVVVLFAEDLHLELPCRSLISFVERSRDFTRRRRRRLAVAENQGSLSIPSTKRLSPKKRSIRDWEKVPSIFDA